MASTPTIQPYMRIDTDPFEQLKEALNNPLVQPHLKPNIKMRDLLSIDIQRQLALDGKLFWFPEILLTTLNEEATRILNEFNLANKEYVVKVGTKRWLKEIWAMPVVMRYKNNGKLVQLSSSWIGDNLEEAIKFLYEAAESGLVREKRTKRNIVLLLVTGRDKNMNTNSSQSRLLALYSRADKRFAQLCTILSIWKERRFDKIDTQGVFSLYAFALLLIQFLQAGCHPPVLPCLHQKRKNLLTCFPANIHFKSRNKKSLGNLLFNFFDYYQMKVNGGFDFDRWKISVKAGVPIKLCSRSRTFYIEDPLKEETNNVVEFDKTAGLSYVLAFTFSQIHKRLMTNRRLGQLEQSIVI